MKQYYFFLLPFAISAQPVIKTIAPGCIEKGDSAVLEVNISNISGTKYSRYQLECPAELTIRGTEAQNGSFSYSPGIAKIIWPVSPDIREIGLKLSMIAGSETGRKLLNQKYFFLHGNEKQEVVAAPVVLYVTDSLNGLTCSSMKVNESLLKNTEPVSGSENMKVQIDQLRKDSKDAYEAGEREKQIAMKKMSEAEKAERDANEIRNDEKRKEALNAAAEEKSAAKAALETAEKILELARSLQENADEIERLSRKIDDSTALATPLRKDSVVPEKPRYLKSNDPAEVKRQIARMKKDAKEARQAGEEEKKKARLKLAGSENIRKKSTTMKDEQEKAHALEVSQQLKEEAENELEVAEKILALADKLLKDALELEKQSASDLHHDQKGITEKQAADKKSREKDAVPDKAVQGTERKAEPAGKANPSGKFFVQVGAFQTKPDPRSFRRWGKVTITEESGLYKVWLKGSFDTREKAQKKRDEIILSGGDAFIVTKKE